MLSFRKLVLTAFAALVLASSIRAVEPDKFIPADAESVTVINVKQTMESALVKKYALDLVKGAIESNEGLQNLTKATGLDVTKDVDTVLFTTAGGVEGKVLVVARGKYDVQKFQTVLEAAAKEKPKELAINKEGNTTIYALTTDGKTNYAAFADNKTIVGSSDKAYLVAALKQNSGPAVAPKKELTASLKKATGKESVYVAMIMTDELKKTLGENDQTKELAKNVTGLSGAITVTDAIQIDLTAGTVNALSAKQLAATVVLFKNTLPGLAKNTGIDQLVPLAEAVQKDMKVTSNQNSASLSLKLTEDVIKKALGM